QTHGEGFLPAPGSSISVIPSGVIAPGGSVTIRCQCRCGARRLFLYKEGIEIQELDTAGEGGEFTIPSARREDTGFYNCRSRSRSEPPSWSDPRDYRRIVVAGEGYPKPSISLTPSGGVALGRTVTIRCECRSQKATFLMYNLGNPDVRRWAWTAGHVAEFYIHNVSRRDTGNYSCQYGLKSDPSVWSHPSDPWIPFSVGPQSQPHTQPDPRGCLPQWDAQSQLYPELWAQQRGRLAGERGRSHSGVPRQGGAAAAGGSGPREGGSLPPGGVTQQGLSQGMLPQPPPLWGRTEELGPKGCSASTSPSSEYTPHQPRQLNP
uniref:Ig-like domain-containing protein n=1 Tax=Chelydra serpentina TaxID=8475 RepID=A0A8C3XKH3_CHESE